TLLACEDPPKAERNATAENAPQARVIPAASTPPAAEPPKPAPRKLKAEDCPQSGPVAFQDSAFEAEVRKKLEKATGEITRAELGKLRSLNVSSVKFDQLDPCVFPHMKALKELYLGPGEYDDLSPLAGLTRIESLRASISQVKDIKPLADMVALDRLDLGRTQVADISPLSNLKLLSELQLDDTQVEDLTPLAKANKLERLSIQRTKVKDVSALKGLTSLKFLYVAGTPLDDDPMSLAPVRAKGVKIIAQ
ncbi:MAG TPA: leucine-rich repeat domain-containing protein, partial [Polyangiaceae bacterium]|nr:leucine-rich repeat domain-containing protein [Polyangiaceae bacterium]